MKDQYVRKRGENEKQGFKRVRPKKMVEIAGKKTERKREKGDRGGTYCELFKEKNQKKR